MIPPEAILRFIDRQKRLLRQTYDQSWQGGVDSYEPDENPPQEPTLPREMAVTGLTGAALLAAVRRYNYQPPTAPDGLRRAVALAGAFRGLNAMTAELSALSGADALQQWVQGNGWRLDAGASAAWAGEQAGFAEAANADGQPLYSWVSAGDERVCPDCDLLAGFPPMALGDWPTSPGAGDTACNVGCRCSWDTFDAPLPAGYSPDLSPDQQDLIDSLSQAQLQTMADLMPDAAYLS